MNTCVPSQSRLEQSGTVRASQQLTKVSAQQETTTALEDSHPRYSNYASKSQSAAPTPPFGASVKMTHGFEDQQKLQFDFDQIQTFLSEAEEDRLCMGDIELDITLCANRFPDLDERTLYTGDLEYRILLRRRYAYKQAMHRNMRKA